jgi:hypothetical protein
MSLWIVGTRPYCCLVIRWTTRPGWFRSAAKSSVTLTASLALHHRVPRSTTKNLVIPSHWALNHGWGSISQHAAYLPTSRWPGPAADCPNREHSSVWPNNPRDVDERLLPSLGFARCEDCA